MKNNNAALLLQNLEDAIICTDINFIITCFNAASEKIYGIKASQAMGKHVSMVIKYDFIDDDYISALTQLKKKGKWEGEVVYQRPDGKKIFLMSTVNYIYDESRKKIGIVAVNKEISELVKERKLRRDAELNMKIILENSGQALFLMDAEYNILLFNRLSYQVIKRIFKTQMKVSGNLLDLLPEYRRQDARNKLEQVRQGKEVEYEICYRSGEWLSINHIPVTQANGDIFEICTSMRDITERKIQEENKIRERLQHQKDISKATIMGQERERNELGQELHDNVNQILVSAKLYIETGISIPDKMKDFVEIGRSQINCAIDEIRKVSKSLVPPSLGDLTLKEALKELAIPLRHIEKKIQWKISRLNEAQICNELKICIYRIVQEQLNNIIKHAEASEIFVQLLQSDKQIHILVADNGKGFDAAKKRNGIGISNILNRAGVLNGTVNIESSPGNGCRLGVKFPLGGEQNQQGYLLN